MADVKSPLHGRHNAEIWPLPDSSGSDKITAFELLKQTHPRGIDYFARFFSKCEFFEEIGQIDDKRKAYGVFSFLIFRLISVFSRLSAVLNHTESNKT